MFKLFQPEILGKLILGKRVHISDPCYSMNTWCTHTLENVLAGEWQASLRLADNGDWGTRVAQLQVNHLDYLNVVPKEKIKTTVGVDSGQAGIFDFDYYMLHHQGDALDEAWYDRVCDLTYPLLPNPVYKPFNESSFWKDSFIELYQIYEAKSKAYDVLIDTSKVMDVEDFLKITEKSSTDPTISDTARDYLKLKEEWEKQDKGKTSELISSVINYQGSRESVKKDHKFYGAVIDGKGAVSSSGDGDGGYTLLVARRKGKIVSICINYYYGYKEG